MRKRELEVRVEELQSVGADDVLVLDCLDLEDLDGGPAGAMTTAQVHVHLFNRAGGRDVSVGLEHVNLSTPAHVANPNAEVLDNGDILLVDLIDGDNLTVGLLDALELAQEVPEARLGDDRVRGEDAHAVHRSFLVGA